MIIIVDWWRISHGKSSPTVTNLNKTIVTNPNPNWRWQLLAANRCQSIFLAKCSMKRSEEFNNVEDHNRPFHTIESSGGYLFKSNLFN